MSFLQSISQQLTRTEQDRDELKAKVMAFHKELQRQEDVIAAQEQEKNHLLSSYRQVSIRICKQTLGIWICLSYRLGLLGFYWASKDHPGFEELIRTWPFEMKLRTFWTFKERRGIWTQCQQYYLDLWSWCGYFDFSVLNRSVKLLWRGWYVNGDGNWTSYGVLIRESVDFLLIAAQR